MKKILGILFVCSLASGVSAQEASNAELLLTPTRVILKDKDRFATVNVKNSGGATGQYTVELQDMVMEKNGAVRPLAEGETQEGSAQNLLRISPRSMTLKPGEIQNVRILLRNPRTLPDGEYRSHLKVRIANDNVESTLKAADADAEQGGIAVRANLALVIPIIIRTGDLHFEAGIKNPKLTTDEAGNAQLNLTLTHTGNRSSMGDIEVTYAPPSGKILTLAKHAGVPVYFPNASRKLTVPLKIPKGITLKGGKIDITYTAQKDEQGKELARASLNP